MPEVDIEGREQGELLESAAPSLALRCTRWGRYSANMRKPNSEEASLKRLPLLPSVLAGPSQRIGVRSLGKIGSRKSQIGPAEDELQRLRTRMTQTSSVDLAPANLDGGHMRPL